MKKVSANLLDHLNTTTSFHMCDLYEIILYSGGVFRYADYDKDITLPDGRFFTCKGPIFERNKIKLSAGSVIDTLDIDVKVDSSDKIGDALFMDLAHNGGFDDAVLSLTRCFFYPDGDIVDTLELFTGEIDTPEGGGLELQLKVKSMANRLNVDYPMRSYLTGCPYSVYDNYCGVALEAFTKIAQVTEATLISIKSNMDFTDGYYDQGGADFMTGVLSGMSVPIKLSTNNTLYFLVPLPTIPAIGDTFKIYPGCDKKPQTCKDKFDNWPNNRATPYIPLPEAIL